MNGQLGSSEPGSSKIAIITGANSGVGFGIAQRILEHVARTSEKITVVLACRNQKRAQNALDSLLSQYPGSDIKILLVDLSSAKSVWAACEEAKKRFSRIDYLFCNAGVLPIQKYDWWRATGLLTHPKEFLSRSEIVVQSVGEMTEEGLGFAFAANVFGHYLMIRYLEDLMAAAGEARIIWTGSCTTEVDHVYDLEDYQAIKSQNPYEATKHSADLISIALNDRLNGRNIYSFTTHPGVVVSSIANLPYAIERLRSIAHYIARVAGLNNQTISGWNGAISNIYAAFKQPITVLDPRSQYGSYCYRLGEPFVCENTIKHYDEDLAKKLLEKLDRLANAIERQYSNN
ncbi:uncharacterized protein VTP21DRAFT_11127 [Calcarisporiella thermophila]|uniref:uncharacterized protein n=1 Tax=Calcarisporiella thermophila TaxID=911321 RepID=UPI0037437C27